MNQNEQPKMKGTTIAAIATPPGTGGIGIIKISGPEALQIHQSIFRQKNRHSPDQQKKNGPNQIETHRLTYGYIFDPDANKIIDEALVSVMRAPRSYTREDVVEIQSHAGFFGLKSIMELVLRHGAQLAEPGEFTKRAYLNGRIDLTQAEAVIDIIHAKSEASLQMASNQVTGRMEKKIQDMISILNHAMVRMEASIDFPEETGEITDTENLVTEISRKVGDGLTRLIDNYDELHVYREGVNIIVLGRPNVGKSSLLNQMLQAERAIVTEIPGTTRDIIQETIHINQIPVTITDTAGIHATDDPIEKIGMEKTQEQLKNADVILFMMDATDCMNEQDKEISKDLDIKKSIILINKIDKVKNKQAGFTLSKKLQEAPWVQISAKHNIGIDRLKHIIEEKITKGKNIKNFGTIVPNLRQRNLLVQANMFYNQIITGLKQEQPPELIVMDVKEAVNHLNEVIGNHIQTDILDQIFSRFCIGK